MGKGKNPWSSSLTGLVVSLITAICFLLIGFLISLYFSGASYPEDLLYTPQDWGNSFFNWFFWGTIASFVFNFITLAMPNTDLCAGYLVIEARFRGY